jgi:hypothetical protein
MILRQSFVNAPLLIAVFAATAASAEESLPTPRSIIVTAEHEQAAQPVILAARRYAAFWNAGEARYAEAAVAQYSLSASGQKPGAFFFVGTIKHVNAITSDSRDR